MTRGRRGSGARNRGTGTPYVNPNPTNNRRGSGVRNRGTGTPYVNPNPSNNQRGEWARKNRNQEPGNTEVKEEKISVPQKPAEVKSVTSTPEPQPKNFGALRYPSEFIHEDQDYLQFQIFRYERGKKSDQKSGINFTPSSGTKGKKGYTASTTSFNQNFSDNMRTSRLVGGPKKLVENRIGTIRLPIPSAISDTNAANYGESKLNDFYAAGVDAVGDAIGAGGMKEFMGSLAAGGQNLANSLKEEGTRNAFNSWIQAKAVGIAGANISPEQLMMRQSAQMINPNMEMLFSGPSVRSFQFLFKFTPRDQNESDEVKQIIRQFKKNMMPRFKGTFLKAPNIFELSYMKGASLHPFLNRFKMCALTNCSTTYTGDGTYATYHDGTPVSMTMNLSFQELTPVYNEDYDNADGAIGVGY